MDLNLRILVTRKFNTNPFDQIRSSALPYWFSVRAWHCSVFDHESGLNAAVPSKALAIKIIGLRRITEDQADGKATLEISTAKLH